MEHNIINRKLILFLFVGKIVFSSIFSPDIAKALGFFNEGFCERLSVRTLAHSKLDHFGNSRMAALKTALTVDDNVPMDIDFPEIEDAECVKIAIASPDLPRLGSMEVIERSFDVLARRVFQPETGLVDEVDLAFVYKGFPEEKVVEIEKLQLPKSRLMEKVYAVGHKGALAFRSHITTPSRYYGVVFSRGTIDKISFRAYARTYTRSPRQLCKRYRETPSMGWFPRITERATAEFGQVHIYFQQSCGIDDGYSRVSVMRDHVLAVVEFDQTGSIISIKSMNRKVFRNPEGHEFMRMRKHSYSLDHWLGRQLFPEYDLY